MQSVMNMIFHKLPHYLILSAVTLAIFACSSSDNSPSANQPPSLSGTPPPTAMQDLQYSFTPTGSDPEGDPLTFTITNMPSWASFDTTSGALTGMPLVQHLGVYANISISVSDGKDSAELPAFSIDVVPISAGSLTLSWAPPMQNADGTPLTDLAGYRIRWGTQSGDHPNLKVVDNSGVSNFVIEGLAPGNYFFTVSAVDTSNNESQASNEASGTVP